MSNPNRRNFLAIAAYVVMVPTVAIADAKIDTHINKQALGGYDAVAYFSDKAAKPGLPQNKLSWNGADWLFASAENMGLFAASPEKYAPQYGGFCAFAAAKGSLAGGDPTVWTVVDGKLYINLSSSVKTLWTKDIPGNISKADANWPSLSK